MWHSHLWKVHWNIVTRAAAAAAAAAEGSGRGVNVVNMEVDVALEKLGTIGRPAHAWIVIKR